MKVLLINDTRAELNPGCQATVSELISFVHANTNNAKIETIAHGDSYDAFNHSNIYLYKKKEKLKNYYIRIGNKLKLFKKSKIKASTFNFNLWEGALSHISQFTKDKIAQSDLVIVNMEGTIHNNRVGGFALLGLAYFAKTQGKKVAMVNGSYQNMPEELTKSVLNRFDFISVREIESYKYLKSNEIDLNLIPDFAFRAKIDEKIEKIGSITKLVKNKKCLYTVGVLGAFPNQKNGINLNQITKHINTIKKMGYSPIFLKIEEAENYIESHLSNLGVSTISYNNGIKYSNMGSVLSEFDLLVTGRYHIGIFGLMTHIKTLFLESNTFKIEGLLEMLNLSHLMINNNDISQALIELKNKDSQLAIESVSDKSYESFGVFLRNLM